MMPAYPSDFDPPDGTVAIALTHVLELPIFLPVPQDSSLWLAEERTPAWRAIPTEASARLLGRGLEAAPGLTEGHVLTTRLVFRSATVGQRLPLEAADVAFGDWVEPLLSERERELRTATLERMRATRLEAPTTVVGATRLLPAVEWSDKGARMSAIDNALEFCLEYLNEYVVALSAFTGDVRSRPIARGELPQLCPVIVEAAGPAERRGVSGLRRIHDVHPSFAGRRTLDRDVLEGAAALAMAGRRGDEPFFLFYELLLAAQAAMLHGQHAQGVVLLGTAVESMIDTILQECLVIEGRTGDEIARIMDLPFARRVRRHLGRVTHTTLDRADESNPLGRWWAHAYASRNAVVHGAHRATRDEASCALETTVALVAALRDGLESDPATAALGHRLRLSPPTP